MVKDEMTDDELESIALEHRIVRIVEEFNLSIDFALALFIDKFASQHLDHAL